MDRARETLFNWLAPQIYHATCLDLFAGSGALGFEALSRGADHATFVDQNLAIINALKANRQMLYASSERASPPCTITRSSAGKWLGSQKARWDIIFLDPPFEGGLLDQTLTTLSLGQNTYDHSLIYVETPQSFCEGSKWRVLKRARVGSTHLSLLLLKPAETNLNDP